VYAWFIWGLFGELSQHRFPRETYAVKTFPGSTLASSSKLA